MIISTKLKNFKGFQYETEFSVSKINLLTGINGRGKSSFLQSILLIRQSLEEQDKFEKVIFNGSCVNLGTFYDVKNRSTGNDSTIDITHITNKGELSLKLVRDEKDDMIGNPQKVDSKNLFFDFQCIHYIAADRVGPQEFYIKSTLPKFINVGTKGELVGNVLLQKKSDLVNEKLAVKELNNEIESYELLFQTGKWLSKILDTEKVKVFVSDNESSRVISLSFGFGQLRFRSANIGFGYTYVLPIVVSGLIAKEGEILIVENPEAHLHPKAQSYLIDFLCEVADSGVQVFIETHSEHILSAIRLSIKNKNTKAKDASVFFFRDNKEDPFIKIDIDDNGGIELWPSDFFDQNEKDLKEFLGF